MIPNQWYVVLDSSQVRDKPVSVIRLGERLLFWRTDSGRVVCLKDTCAHRGARLSYGRLMAGRIQCPFHGLEFDGTGWCRVIPANGKTAPVPERFRVTAYPVSEAHGWIWIWWGAAPPADLSPPRYFTGLERGFSSSLLYDNWRAHYSRVIENQLDVMHLPFVHYNTIGRGGRTLIDGPGLELVDPDFFRLYVYNRQDNGTPPRKPQEVPVPDPASSFRIEFLFPNLWQNHISEKVRLVVAFVPVDEEQTIVYLRFYQKFIRLPLLRSLSTRMKAPWLLVWGRMRANSSPP